MNYDDCITIATQRALDWGDLPDELLPLVIASEAAALAGGDSGRRWAWDAA